MKKEKTTAPKPPTLAQLQEKIKILEQDNQKLELDRDEEIIALGEAIKIEQRKISNQQLVIREQAGEIARRYNPGEVLIMILCVSLGTFMAGLFIGHKITKRGELNFNMPMKPVVCVEPAITTRFYTNEFIPSIYTNLPTTNRPTWITKPNIIFTNPYVWKPNFVKLYHPIITRKGAEMLRQ